MVADPMTGLPIHCFCLLIHGEPAPAKKIAWDNILKLFSVHLCKKEFNCHDVFAMSEQELAELELQLTTLAACFKHLFAQFQKNHVLIAQSDFKSMPDAFASNWACWM